MNKPFLQDEAFLADVRRALTEPEQLHLWWLGQSGFLLQWQARHLLLDPYLSDSLTAKYAGTEKPHVRLTERVVAPERLDVDVVTSSHNHTDHLDAATILPLMQANPGLQVLVSEANRAFAAERLGVALEQLTGICAGHTISIPPFTFHGAPSAHETPETDEQGRHRFMGLVVQAGPWTIYHSGDTVLYHGMAENLRQWEIDIALLPINGRDAARGVPGNLSGREAVTLARNAGARLVIPCHYDMFEFNTVSPDEFVAAARDAGQPYRVLRNGERYSTA